MTQNTDVSDTRARIRALRESDPNATAAEIARALGLTRERVRQQLVALGLPTTTTRSFGAMGRHGRQAPPPVATIITGGVPAPMSPSAAGTVAELLAAADLMARGFQVFFPLVRRTGSCDLITLGRQGRTERIEVRSGHRYARGIAWRHHERHKADRCAIVLRGEPVQYSPPLETPADGR